MIASDGIFMAFDHSSTLSPWRTKRVDSVHPAPQDREDPLRADLRPSTDPLRAAISPLQIAS
jgi:hypothetical protein